MRLPAYLATLKVIHSINVEYMYIYIHWSAFILQKELNIFHFDSSVMLI